MKLQIATAALVLAVVPALAQSSLTGVSSPDAAAITTSNESIPQSTDAGRHPLTTKPQAGTPATAPASSGEVYGAFVPYAGAVAASPIKKASIADSDAEIVTSVPDREGQLREGTLLRVEMQQVLSTSTTLPGTKFSALIVEPVENNGRVIIPVGSIVDGQVTEVHGGRRISGGAALHLEPRSVTLPDGTHYIMHAQLIDTSRSDFRVDNEGTLKRKDHAKQTLAVMSLTTGGSAVVGGMIGGGVGAVVGAGVGAGISTFLWLKEDRQATVQANVRLVFSLTTPMILTPLSNGSVSRVTAPAELSHDTGAAQ